jgi:transcriptional regulator with XRE-family HTH domain
MTELDVPGALRRIRRRADMSQRQLADASGMAASVVAKVEAGTRDLPVRAFARLAAVAGFRVALLDASGIPVDPMTSGSVRDAGGRLFPAHLDTRHGDEDWWGGPHRPRLRQPRYTFDMDRGRRDWLRSDRGMPDDHHVPRPGDSLEERAAERRRATARRAAERRQRHFLATLGRQAEPFDCTCPAGCEYAEGRNEDLGHAAECACRCDVS